jgi:hypothetical protein
MAWYSPKQKIDTKRWDFTCSNSAGTFPMGYCAGWKDWTQEDADRINMPLERLKKLEEESLPFKHKYHSDGHATSAEACNCWRDYQFDQERRTYASEETQRKCAECGEWTNGVVVIGRELPYTFFLCPKHQDEATTKKVWEAKYEKADRG